MFCLMIFDEKNDLKLYVPLLIQPKPNLQNHENIHQKIDESIMSKKTPNENPPKTTRPPSCGIKLYLFWTVPLESLAFFVVWWVTSGKIFQEKLGSRWGVLYFLIPWPSENPSEKLPNKRDNPMGNKELETLGKQWNPMENNRKIL